jgi:small GTP-binding protein
MNNGNKPKYIYKVVVIGDGAVGKTSLINKCVENKFEQSYLLTIGSDFKVKEFEFDNFLIKLQLWDLAGQDRFKCVRESYYQGALGIIGVFDLTNPASMESLYTKWILGEMIPQLKKYHEGCKDNFTMPPMV